MTRKEHILKVLQHKPVGKIPYMPRLDLWYNANSRAGTLPPGYADASLSDIVDDLNFGFHGIVPDFKDVRMPEDEIHRGLGVYNLWMMPFKTRFENVQVMHDTSGDDIIVTYETPKGKVSTRAVHNEDMKKAGITISHLAEHPIKSHKDYQAIAHIFDNAVVEPDHTGYDEFRTQVGDRGCAAAFVSLAGSPMHLLLRELMPFDLFSYEIYDHPDEMAACAESIGRYFERVFEVVADCSADVVLFGANYDAMLTYPPFFKDHIVPWLKKFGDILHAKGKYLLTHTDGENTGLLDHYLEAGFDIADSICPKPMTKLSFKEVREVFGDKIVIMGGIPSVCLLKESMADRDFEAFLDGFFEEIGDGRNLILGISDTTPPGADFERLKKIGERIDAFSIPF